MDFSKTFTFNKTPQQVFDAVTNVRGWWSSVLEGESCNQGDEFVYRYKDLHYSRQRLTEVIPNQKVVWLITDSSISFVENTKEWDNTTVTFDISGDDEETKLKFTHHGLTPQLECFEACSGGWSHYLESLHHLITTENGHPYNG